MDNLKIIYRILKYIDDCMDYDVFDESGFTAQAFGVTEARFHHLVESLIDAGYISGIRLAEAKGDLRYMVLNSPRLTAEVMEYLEENSMMKKAYKLLRGIKDVTPGL